jgi:hypothetical protein
MIFHIEDNTEDGLNSEIQVPTAAVEIAEFTAPPIVTAAVEQAGPDSFPEPGGEKPGDSVRIIDPMIIVALSIFLALSILLFLGVKRVVNQR